MISAALLAVGLAAAAAEPPVRVPLRGTARLDVAGATAAFAVDDAVAEASVGPGGAVVLRGRHVGATHVSVVTASGDVLSRAVLVEAPARSRPAGGGARPGAARTRLETRYESVSGRLWSGVEIAAGRGDRSSRLDLLHVQRLDAPAGGDAASALARASLELRAPSWQVVLLDARVEHTPLTLDGTTLRGAHLRAGPLELHAGVTSPLWIRGFLLPGERETAAGGSYRLSLGEAGTLAPVVYGFWDAERQGGESGGVASLLYERGRPGEPLRVRAEAGFGGEWGGALRLAYAAPRLELRLDGRHLPEGFASLGTGRARGSTAEASGVARPARRVELAASGSATRQDLGALAQRRAAASGQLRLALPAGWSATGGASLSRSRAGGLGLETRTFPVGLGWQRDGLSASGQLRWRKSSLPGARGLGGRAGAALRSGGFRASAQVDAQRDGASLELLLRETPELARLLAELGLDADTPEDLERLLRDEPELAAALDVAGVSLELEPWRISTRADLSWTSGDESRQELSARVQLDRARSTRRLEDGGHATLSYARRAFGPWDAFGAVTAWAREGAAGAAARGWSWTAGLRVSFAGAPRLPRLGASTVEGRVVRDEGADGLEVGARVRLDGRREVLTDAEGRFAFAGAGPGPHQVELVLPLAPGAYFTTPSTVTASPGEPVSFGLGRTPARLTGRLRDDSGAGVAGAAVSLAGPVTLSATTDSGGRFSLAGPPGDYTLELERASLAPGYDLAALAPRAVRLDRDVPASEELVVDAFRSISGTVRGREVAGSLVWLVEPYAMREVGPDGRYVFRGLAPGRYTVAVQIGDRFVRRGVDVPPGPAAITGIDFGAAP